MDVPKHSSEECPDNMGFANARCLIGDIIFIVIHFTVMSLI
jgi:hypothetical protein